MLRFLIERGYQDKEAQGVISEALGVIYQSNGIKEESHKDDNPEGGSVSNDNDKSDNGDDNDQ